MANEAGPSIEVRLLDGFRVRGCDGRLVDVQEWHTAKTQDLLRLLALRAGEPVSVDQILEWLWPTADPRRARGSLRTAVSVLRHALGAGSLRRVPNGLVLVGAWVDIVELTALARDLAQALRAGRAEQVVATAHAVEAIYRQDFRASDDDACWAVEVRERLRLTRTAVHLDAGEAALELRWMRDALDFGDRAFAADRSSERACRVLMAAHAGLGEVGAALRVYEDLRLRLADELGTDPSPQTRALHHCLLLSGPAPGSGGQVLVGRDRQVAVLAERLSGPGPDGVRVVCVRGRAGSGRHGLITATLAGLGTTSQPLPRTDQPMLPAAPVPGTPPRGTGRVHVAEPVERLDGLEARDVAATIAALGQRGRACLVVPATPGGVRTVRTACERAGAPPPLVVDVPDLDAGQLRQLAEQTLSGRVSEQLVTELATLSGGRAGTASRILRGWAATSRFAWTPRGLVPTTDPVTAHFARRAPGGTGDERTPRRDGPVDQPPVAGTGTARPARVAEPWRLLQGGLTDPTRTTPPPTAREVLQDRGREDPAQEDRLG